jgi:DeoD family purine-nucleoside phosphorylase
MASRNSCGELKSATSPPLRWGPTVQILNDRAATIHLNPTAELAERVLLPGDPGRALLLAQTLLTNPLMFNHNRGLWGYTGAAADGLPLTIQSTGMGGPSAAIVIEELARLGAKRLVRVGTCGAVDAGLALGDLVVADPAQPGDGASRALGAGETVAGDAELTDRLAEHAHARGPIASADLFYPPGEAAGAQQLARWRGEGTLAVEMECAALFRLAELRGFRAGCICAVSDLVETGERLDADALAEAAERLGRAAADALA